MNPSIPTEPCVKCGIATNATQSIYGIAHLHCYQDATPVSIIADLVPATHQDYVNGQQLFTIAGVRIDNGEVDTHCPRGEETVFKNALEQNKDSHHG